ncbi:MAG TPA: tRNA 2-thiouridine(34) synthase MnmA [Methylomirabilota bacterium]|nr:tRNA 2-thiouridine(34) synthase MnmA [Methylomirabilota bacterium]
MRAERIVVGMSGGVDSSVAAALLVEAGHEAIGVTMRVWPASSAPAARAGACCGSEAVGDARRVAATLGIPYYALNMADEFDRAVIGPFADAYRRGRTPVPCVACNTELKFGSLLARARAWDAAAVATGHYARVDRAPAGHWRLRRARDTRKDQSDFLWPLTQAQLAAARFPIGELTKDEVRGRARRLGLATADKPESQEICFVPDDDYRGFLRRRDPAMFRPGPIVDRAGHVLGRHAGVAGFTIGQRRGLGLASDRALYVVDLDPATERVTVGQAADLERDRLVVGSANFIAGAAPTGPLRVAAKIRHNQPPAPAVVRPLGTGRAEVVFDAPQRAVTPGQSCVWYREDEVVGGGVIERDG